MNLVLSTGSWFSQFCEGFTEHMKEAFTINIGGIGEEISHGILQWQHFFDLGGKTWVITDATIASWVAMILMLGILALLCSKLKIVPDSKQTILELIVDLIISSAMGFGLNRKQAEKIMPMIGTVGLFILASNLIAWFKVAPPAKNIAFPVALALFGMVYVIGVSISMVGVKGFVSTLFSPMPALFPFKILDYIIKPVSLSLRLFGNVFGAFVFMEFISLLVPVVLPGILGLWFDLIDALIQAVVFAYLMMSYIGEIVEGAHEAEEIKKEKLEKKEKKKLEKLAEAKS